MLIKLEFYWDTFWYRTSIFCSKRISKKGRLHILKIMKAEASTPLENPPTYH